MGKKNRGRGKNGGSATVADSEDTSAGARALCIPTTAKSSVTEVLWYALEALDEVAEESHRHRQRQQSQQLATNAESRKRARDGAEENSVAPSEAELDRKSSAAATASSLSLSAVYAAMARPHYETLATATAAFGLQLLPVLHEITRRVGLAVGTPLLASAESWETAAMLCSYYSAGPAAKMVEELMELLVRARGVFFFDAPCVVAAAAPDDDSAARPSVLVKMDLVQYLAGGRAKAKDAVASCHGETLADRQLLEGVVRKLGALREMLAAVGAYLPSSLLQRVALRFVFEVVEGGMLRLEGPLSSSFAVTASTSSTTTAAALGKGEQRMCWRVPAACQAACLAVLQTLLMLRGSPAEVAVCATRVVSEVTASLHQGCPVRPAETAANGEKGEKSSTPAAVDSAAFYATWPDFCLYRDLVAASVQLRQTLSLLRHPPVVPLYSPPTYAEERIVKKTVVVATESAAAPEAALTTAPFATGSHSGNDEDGTAVVVASLAAAPPAHPEHPALAAPPPRTAVAAAFKAPEAVKPYVKESLHSAPPVRPIAHSTSGSNDADEESIPEIDMDDDDED